MNVWVFFFRFEWHDSIKWLEAISKRKKKILYIIYCPTSSALASSDNLENERVKFNVWKLITWSGVQNCIKQQLTRVRQPHEKLLRSSPTEEVCETLWSCVKLPRLWQCGAHAARVAGDDEVFQERSCEAGVNTPRRNVDLVLIFNTIQYIYIYKYISFLLAGKCPGYSNGDLKHV